MTLAKEFELEGGQISGWLLAKSAFFLFFAFHVAFGFLGRHVSDALPLVYWGSLDEIAWIRWGGVAIQAIAAPALFFFSRSRVPLFAVILTMFIEGTFSYSQSDARQQVLASLGVFFLIFPDPKDSAAGGRVNLALIMISSALLKINPTFLAGGEFFIGGDVFTIMSPKFSVPQFFPKLIIILEVALGVWAVGAGPRLLLLYMFFPLTVIYVAPLLGFAFIGFFPFLLVSCIGAVPRIMAYAILMGLGGLLFGFYFLAENWSPTSSLILPLRVFFCFILVLGIVFIIRETSFLQTRFRWIFSKRVTVWAVVLFLYFATSHLGWVPPPHGGSMYSSRNSYQAEVVLAGRDCTHLMKKYRANLWSFRIEPQSEGCRIRFFNEDGIQYLMDKGR